MPPAEEWPVRLPSHDAASGPPRSVILAWDRAFPSGTPPPADPAGVSSPSGHQERPRSVSSQWSLSPSGEEYVWSQSAAGSYGAEVLGLSASIWAMARSF